MSFELPGAGAPETLLCRYGASRLMCRGPRRKLDGPYIAFLGENETFGKFVDRPFVERVEEAIGWDCINLGSANSGLDAYALDRDIQEIASRARVTVIQVMGAQNLSNRYYRVHPRRNDRFLAASPLLSAIYGEVDFTDFHFNKHLLNTLRQVSPTRFRAVQEELQAIWLTRMRLLLGVLPHKPVLLWLRYECEADAMLGPEPLLVGRSMLQQLGSEVAETIEVPVTRIAESSALDAMRFGPMQAPAAAHMIGPDTHRVIAEKVASALRGIL